MLGTILQTHVPARKAKILKKSAWKIKCLKNENMEKVENDSKLLQMCNGREKDGDFFLKLKLRRGRLTVRKGNNQ